MLQSHEVLCFADDSPLMATMGTLKVYVHVPAATESDTVCKCTRTLWATKCVLTHRQTPHQEQAQPYPDALQYAHGLQQGAGL
jgi:hypothetical protein